MAQGMKPLPALSVLQGWLSRESGEDSWGNCVLLSTRHGCRSPQLRLSGHKLLIRPRDRSEAGGI